MAERWRTGRKVGHHIYEQTGPEPSDRDRWVASFVNPDEAEVAVAATNLGTRLLAVDQAISELVTFWAGGGRGAETLVRLLDQLVAQFNEMEAGS